MFQLKMTGELYEDVKTVDTVIQYLHSMVSTLEKECIKRDEGKVATELFILINSLKDEVTKMVSESERILRRADLDQFGPLSKYVRPYLGF